MVIHTIEPARDGIQPPIDKVWGYCAANGIAAKTATLKAKYADFNQITRSKTVSVPFREVQELQVIVDALLEPVFPISKGMRLLGITLSSLERAAGSDQPQLALLL